MTPRRGRRRVPTYLLWAAFAGAAVVCGVLLLRACGLLLPLAAVPGFGWDFCPATPSALSVEAERSAALRAIAAGLELELGRKQLACTSVPPPLPPPLDLPIHAGRPLPQQTSLLKPLPPPRPPEPLQPPSSLPADRWAMHDLSMLEGCWLVGHEYLQALHNSNGTILETCTAFAAKLCFSGSGGGQLQESAICPASGRFDCRAAFSATFNNDETLSANWVSRSCNTRNDPTDGGTLNCRRIDDSTAMCKKTDRYGYLDGLLFRRAQ